MKVNLKILEFLKDNFINDNISKLNSIIFNIDEKYPSQISSNDLIINFDNLSIKLIPFGKGTYQNIKIGYSTETLKGKYGGYTEFDKNKLILNLNILDFEYYIDSGNSELIIICEDGLKHRFYAADYNTKMKGSFRSSNDQNLKMEIFN